MRIIGYAIALGLIVWFLMQYKQPQEEPEGVIPAAYQQSLEKADGVEQLLQEGAQTRAREIEQSEQ